MRTLSHIRTIVVMKKIIITIIFTLSINVSARTIVTDTYFNNKTINWTTSGSPYIIQKNITLSSSTLNIDNAQIIFENASINLFNNSFVNIKDSDISGFSPSSSFSSFNSKFSIKNTKINNNKFIESYGSNVDMDNIISLNSSNQNLFGLYGGSNFSLINSHIENYKGLVFKIQNANKVNIKNTEFVNNESVIELYYASSTFINKNDFEHNNIAIESYMYDYDNKYINMEDNYFEKDNPTIYQFKDDAGPNENNILAGPFSISIFSKNKNIKKLENCCSNIIFLPGVMGSRLYMSGLTENQLWEPNRNTDVKKLYLDEFGKSINNIFTKDIIVKTNLLGGLPFIDKDIYKDFVAYLDKLKKDKIVADYNVVPYDWRMSADYILSQGIKTKDNNIDLIKTIQDLQKTSRTGKVTIITHSNGGLVAKQLIIELQKQKLENIIDNVIFVAMPEYGTAQAITALMFGHQQALGGGLIMRSSIARELGKNMPTAYTFLPSEKYYTYKTNSDKLLNETVVRNYSRVNPLLQQKANALHEELDNIVYSSNINIYQILGTGINTMSDIKLDDKNMFKIIPIYNKNGDGVVEDIYESRFGTTTFVDLSKTVYKHVNIMNSDKVIEIINKIIKTTPPGDNNHGLDYYKIIKNNNYKLLRINSSEAAYPNSQYLPPLYMDLSLGMTKLNDNPDNQLYIDKYHTNNLSNFDSIIESLNNNNRFALYDKGINYLYSDNLENMSINSKNNNTIDISILENVDGAISELEYKNIPIFKNSEMIFEIDDKSDALNINLPLTGQMINFQTKKSTTSSSEDINKIISNIKSSKMESYLKDRYIRRIEMYKKNKDEKYLITLKKRITDSVDSIGNLTHSPALKGRYSKLKEDYVYLNLLLLIL
jgi:hypothetical protein